MGMALGAGSAVGHHAMNSLFGGGGGGYGEPGYGNPYAGEMMAGEAPDSRSGMSTYAQD